MNDMDRTRIVVGLDSSPGARAALAFALGEAARRDAVVEAITAFETPVDWPSVHGLHDPDWPTVDQARDAAAVDAARIVDEVVSEVPTDSGGPPAVPVPVPVSAVAGSAAAVLLHAARGADLLVVGNRGRGGVASALLGSVSMQCVLHAACPVTVVHAAAGSARPVTAPA